MCNCIERIESKVLDNIKQSNNQNNYKELGTYSGNGFENKTTPFTDNKIESPIITLPMSFSYTFIKKNGSESVERKTKVSMSCTYCPFCGKKLNEE